MTYCLSMHKIISCIFLCLAFSSTVIAAPRPTDRTFAKFDLDKNGSLQLMEFARLMVDTQPGYGLYRKTTFREFFRADLNLNDALNTEEFYLWMRRPHQDLAGEIIERFPLVDRNRDEMLSAAELTQLYRPKLSKKAALAEITRLDSNGDAKLTRAECFRYMSLDCRTFLGMKRSDAETLLQLVNVSAFVWRQDDIAYPFDPVIGQVQPLFFWGTSGDIITDCALRLNTQLFIGQAADAAIAAAATYGIQAARTMFPRFVDCMTSMMPADVMPLIYCPPYDDYGLPYPINEGRNFPTELFLEIGSFDGKVEYISLSRGGPALVFIQ
jgi:hypothetical protein